MVRTYKRKTGKGMIDKATLEAAENDVKEKKMSIRQSARRHNMSFMTLSRYLKRKEEYEEGLTTKRNFVGYVKPRQLFTDKEEEQLAEHILKRNINSSGMTSEDVRCLAYEFAVIRKIVYPKGWGEKKEASEDWLMGFLKRHPNVSLRKQRRKQISSELHSKKSKEVSKTSCEVLNSGTESNLLYLKT